MPTNAQRVARIIKDEIGPAAQAAFPGDEAAPWIAAVGAWLRMRGAMGCDVGRDQRIVLAMFEAAKRKS
jgi:hypothetical protein